MPIALDPLALKMYVAPRTASSAAGKPSCLQATSASGSSQVYLSIAPHVPAKRTSTRPAYGTWAAFRRMWRSANERMHIGMYTTQANSALSALWLATPTRDSVCYSLSLPSKTKYGPPLCRIIELFGDRYWFLWYVLKLLLTWSVKSDGYVSHRFACTLVKTE